MYLTKKLEEKVCFVRESSPANSEGIYSPDFEVEYYLMESEHSNDSEAIPARVYGIELVKKRRDDILEHKAIKDFSINRNRTAQAISRLASGSVTPIGLEYALDSILEE